MFHLALLSLLLAWLMLPGTLQPVRTSLFVPWSNEVHLPTNSATSVEVSATGGSPVLRQLHYVQPSQPAPIQYSPTKLSRSREFTSGRVSAGSCSSDVQVPAVHETKIRQRDATCASDFDIDNSAGLGAVRY
ncbi:uncharacterized protein LOC124267437 isoform X2 [Haliotis rubra]|uniref:uncharacterized protein LOC124267437 isoform X2 n=1 Tax=Haliotis rubra TaxID=36100 RepID=UPI001EE4FDE8|nr:uncharacterized protein LOC124267437 isoform X2 [Haliotis rubra]